MVGFGSGMDEVRAKHLFDGRHIPSHPRHIPRKPTLSVPECAGLGEKTIFPLPFSIFLQKLVKIFGLFGLVGLSTTSQPREVALEVSDIDFHPVEFVRPGHAKSLKRLVLLLDYRAEDNLDFHDLMVSAELTASSAHLKHLDVNLLDDVDLITKHAVSAENLTIHCYYFPEFVLPANPALRSVTIDAYPRMGVIYTLHEVLRFIARLSSAAPKLEFLAISIFGFDRETWRSETLPPSSDADDALMELPNLRNMRFSVGCEAPEFEEGLRAALPRSVAAGLLSFPTDIEPPDRWDTTAFFSQ
ncbi:hypothetical protein C8J57DRAFT_1235101 [Mycena rebaudengoi]|nr:hypothetical protein C8J57DRAFT_1235101 [Mycena rebaudengoi]